MALENQQRKMLWGIKECGVNLEREEHWNRSEKALATYGTETYQNQGRGVGVDTGVGVGRSRLFWPDSELESVKFGRPRLRSGVAG